MKAEHPPLYREVADKVAALIREGVLRPGERLPSLRRVSAQHGVSLTTAVQAYLLLEDQGLAEGRPKSGFFVRALKTRLAEPKASKPLRSISKVTVGALQSRLFEAAMMPQIAPLGGAVPSPDVLPTVKLNRILANLSRAAGKRGVSYDMPPGAEGLRRQIAKRAMDAGVTMLPDEIITTCGATEALMLCLRAVAQPGGVVAVESPTYFGILHVLEELGLKTIEIPMHPRVGMDLDALERVLNSRSIAACLAVPTFSNPLGSLMPEANKRRLVRMLAGRGVPLIEDDVFGELPFEGQRPVAAKAFDKDGSVLLCGSFSKSLAPGYRVGWVAPGRYYERVKALKLVHTLATATLPQLAIAEFLGNGGYDHYLRSVRTTFAGNIRRASETVAECFPSGTKITQPAGGFLLWIEMPEGVDAVELHDRALAKNINIAPGPMFSPVQGFRHFIRISCGEIWSARTAEAIRTLGKLAGQMV